jgi:hypothetical protein
MKTETNQLLNSALEILENARLAEEYKQEIEKYAAENANLRQEVVSFKFICDTNEACINNQYDLIKEISDERDHWKANHDNQVTLKSTLIQRPDLRDRSSRMQELISKLDIARVALYEAIHYGDLSLLPASSAVDNWEDAYASSCYISKK